MRDLLALLQILQILGTWISTLIRNYHITSGLLLIYDVLKRLASDQSRPITLWEITLAFLLFIWYYKKHFSKSRKIAVSSAVINIQSNSVNCNISKDIKRKN